MDDLGGKPTIFGNIHTGSNSTLPIERVFFAFRKTETSGLGHESCRGWRCNNWFLHITEKNTQKKQKGDGVGENFGMCLVVSCQLYYTCHSFLRMGGLFFLLFVFIWKNHHHHWFVPTFIFRDLNPVVFFSEWRCWKIISPTTSGRLVRDMITFTQKHHHDLKKQLEMSGLIFEKICLVAKHYPNKK